MYPSTQKKQEESDSSIVESTATERSSLCSGTDSWNWRPAEVDSARSAVAAATMCSEAVPARVRFRGGSPLGSYYSLFGSHWPIIERVSSDAASSGGWGFATVGGFGRSWGGWSASQPDLWLMRILKLNWIHLNQLENCRHQSKYHA